MKYSVDDIKKRIGADVLSPEMAEEALATFVETLDLRVGDAILEVLNEQQVAEFEQFKDDGSDDQKIEEWLLSAVPNRDEIVDREMDKLFEEIDKGARLPDESAGSETSPGENEAPVENTPEATSEEAPVPEQPVESSESDQATPEPEQPSDQPQDIPEQEPAPEAGPEPLPEEEHQHE